MAIIKKSVRSCFIPLHWPKENCYAYPPSLPSVYPRLEHDACGIGAVVRIDGRRDHDTVDKALQIVEKLEHRTGKNASGDMGDGVGIMVQISHRFFSEVARMLSEELGDAGDYGIGMLFLPQDPLRRSRSKKLLEIILKKEGMRLLFWREVPCHPEILGSLARNSKLYLRVNKEMVSVGLVTEKKDIAQLRDMIQAHVAATGSVRGQEILGDFERYIGEFKKIVPRDYSRMLEKIAFWEAKGLTREEAELEAFLKRGE